MSLPIQKSCIQSRCSQCSRELGARETFEAKVHHLNWTPIRSLQYCIWLAAPFEIRLIESRVCVLGKYNIDSFHEICIYKYGSRVCVDCECELKCIWNIYDFAENVENNNTSKQSQRENGWCRLHTAWGVQFNENALLAGGITMHWAHLFFLSRAQCTHKLFGIYLFFFVAVAVTKLHAVQLRVHPSEEYWVAIFELQNVVYGAECRRSFGWNRGTSTHKCSI